MTPGLASAIRSGLNFIAALSGDENSVEVPLEFRDGRARIGPVPVGPAPVLSRALGGEAT